MVKRESTKIKEEIRTKQNVIKGVNTAINHWERELNTIDNTVRKGTVDAIRNELKSNKKFKIKTKKEIKELQIKLQKLKKK